MGQAQNGCWTQDIQAAPCVKSKADESKDLWTRSLCSFIAKSAPYIPLSFLQVEKTKRESFNNVDLLPYFVLFSFSFFVMYNSKTIQCIWIIHVPNDCSATGILPFLVWGGTRAMATKLSHSVQSNVVRKLLCLLFTSFDVTLIVRTYPDYWTHYGLQCIC